MEGENLFAGSGAGLLVDGGHEPTLGTILMVEKAIKTSKTYPTKRALWQSLPRQVHYQTFNRIIDYLVQSSKIILNQHEIVWVFPDPTLKEALLMSVCVSRRSGRPGILNLGS